MGLENRLAFLVVGALILTSCVGNKEPQPHECREIISGLPSQIVLPLGQAEFGTGVQIINIEDKLSQQPSFRGTTTDQSCTRTSLSIDYFPDTTTLVVSGTLYYPDRSTHPYLWKAIDFNYNPNPEDRLTILWSGWKVGKVEIGKKDITLLPSPTPTS